MEDWYWYYVRLALTFSTGIFSLSAHLNVTEQLPLLVSRYNLSYTSDTSYYDQLNSLSLENIKEITSHPHKFVTLWPKKASNGGFGNVIYHFHSVQGLAIATKSRAIINHALLQLMFDHPDKKNGKSWRHETNEDVLKLMEGHHSTDLIPCGQVSKTPMKYFADIIFVHGCYGNNLMHPDVRGEFSKIIKLEYSLQNHHLYADSLFSVLMQWTFSNPTIILEDCVEAYMKRITDLCYANHTFLPDKLRVIDVALQMRLFRDNRANAATGADNSTLSRFHDCGLQTILDAQVRRQQDHTDSVRSSPACVFITSDDPVVASIVANTYRTNPEITAKIVTYDELTPNNTEWLSIELMNTAQGKNSAGVQHVCKPAFLDWMILSKALSTMCTAGSTYCSSARFRAGYANMWFDTELVGDKCLPVRKTSDICGYCKVHKCPADVLMHCFQEHTNMNSN